MRPSNDDIEKYKIRYGYNKGFDVVLLTPDSVADLSKRVFYESLREGIESLGRSVFLPHKEINSSLKEAKIKAIMRGIVIPLSEIVVCEPNLEEKFIRDSVNFTRLNKTPTIYMYETGTDVHPSFFVNYIWFLAEYGSRKQAIDLVSASIRDFYKKLAPLMPYV